MLERRRESQRRPVPLANGLCVKATDHQTISTASSRHYDRLHESLNDEDNTDKTMTDTPAVLTDNMLAQRATALKLCGLPSNCYELDHDSSGSPRFSIERKAKLPLRARVVLAQCTSSITQSRPHHTTPQG